MPRQTTGPAIPHQVENLPYGSLRIPVLNYSPDMVSGAPCPLGASLTCPALPKLTLDLDGLRFPGAAIIPDDPCVTQRALDLAVYALSHASPDRPMKNFLAGLKEIARRAAPIAYGRSDVGQYYRAIYLEEKAVASLRVRESAAAGGGMFFLPPGHEGKRLYWLLVHPPGDPRLRPIAYAHDEDIMAEQRRATNNDARRRIESPVTGVRGRLTKAARTCSSRGPGASASPSCSTRRTRRWCAGATRWPPRW